MNTPEQRLFFSLWPEPPVRAALAGLRADLPRRRGRPVHPDDLHVTLAFLGSVAAERRPCVERAADAVRAPGFDLVLDRLGCWRRSGVLWAGAAVVPESLSGLAAELQRRLRDCGFEPERRPFAAHLTLKRHAAWSAQRDIEPIAWPVQAFVLVASRLGGPAPRYQVLRRWPLGP